MFFPYHTQYLPDLLQHTIAGPGCRTFLRPQRCFWWLRDEKVGVGVGGLCCSALLHIVRAHNRTCLLSVRKASVLEGDECGGVKLPVAENWCYQLHNSIEHYFFVISSVYQWS
jgi:hypothetical protein